MTILTVKLIHMSSVLLSYLLFFIRGIWMLQESNWLKRRWVKIVPHVIDTILLASAITLAVMLSVSPLEQSWLLAKIIALIFYILLGTLALKRGKTRKIRMTCLILAQAIFIYIVWVAITHHPAPWFAN